MHDSWTHRIIGCRRVEGFRDVWFGKWDYSNFWGWRSGKRIKFNCHYQQYHLFSTLDPLFMLVSRFLPQIKLLYRSYAFASYNNAATSSSIFNKILQTRNFTDFLNLHKDNQSEFNGELFASTSKHINSLISGKDRIKFTQIDEFFKQLQAVSVDSLNERHTLGLLSLLRNIKNKGFVPNGLYKFKEVLVKRYNSLIKEREPTENDIPDFINAYFEVSGFQGHNQCRTIAVKLLKALESAKEKGKTSITANQIGFLFYAFSFNSEVSNIENRIRSILMQKVNSELQTIKIHDLIKIAVNLNRSDSFDFEMHEFRIISKITEKILNSISELEERSIYDLIRPENVGRLPGFMKIYEQIHRNIYNEINDNGETELTYDSTFRILGHLSDKLSLKDFKDQQKKFFALVSKYAKQCNEENSKQFPIKLFDLVSNNYLSQEHRQKFVAVLTETKPHLNTNLLYEMAVKGYQIGAFNKFIDAYEINSLRIDVLVKLGIVVNQMVKNGADSNAKLQQIETKIAEYFATPEKFIEFYRIVRNERNESISLRSFHEAFSHLFNKLPNPFQTQGGSSAYTNFYLQYVVDSFKYKELGQFFTKHEAAIKTEEFVNLINYNSKGDARELECNRLLIQHLNKRVYEFIESKNKKWIGALIEFLNKHNRYVVSGKLDFGSHSSILRMLHILISKIDIIAECQQDFFLFSILEKFLVKNHHNYNVQASYRNLLRHVIFFLDKIQVKKHHLFTTVLQEGLRLNMITPKSLEKIVIDKLPLSFMDKSRIEYIKDNKYTPRIDNINQGSLYVLFTNHNLEKVLEQKETQIIEVINNQISSKDIVEYLSIFSAQNSPPGRRLLAALLSQLIIKTKGKSFERHNIIGLLQNALEQGFYVYYQFKNITELIIEDYKKRINNYQLENHLELVKFIVSQPGLNPTDYYQQLVDYATKREDISSTQFQQLLLRLVNTNYKFKPSELKEVTNIMKKNPYTGIFFFLMVEQDLDPAFRKETVKQFVQRFNEKRDGKETFNKLYYQYLKKVYPEETTELNIDEGSLYYERFSNKPKDTELLNTIIQISGGQSQEITGFGDNYILKIKNFGIKFIYSKKLGSYYDHEFLKRALPIITGENLTFVGVHFYTGNNANTLEYLNKQCPNLFENEAYEAVLKTAKNKKYNRGQSEN